MNAATEAMKALGEAAERAGLSLEEFIMGKDSGPVRYVENRAERRKREQAERRAQRKGSK